MAEFEQQDATVMAISADSPEKSLEIAEAYDLEFPILSDPELQAIDAFGVRHPSGNPMDGLDIARPATFIVDRDGNVVWRDLTENWRVRVRAEQLVELLADLP